MKNVLDYRSNFLCVLAEFEAPGLSRNYTLAKEWYPVHATEEVEARALVGRPVTPTDSEEGIYVDEEGNVFQLLNKGETKPIEIEHLPGGEKTERELATQCFIERKETARTKRRFEKGAAKKSKQRT